MNKITTFDKRMILLFVKIKIIVKIIHLQNEQLRFSFAPQTNI